jgi:predicted O-methyltransferase YrrM
MAMEHRSPDWREYKMDWTGDPHPVKEPLEAEIRVVARALEALGRCGILPHGAYDEERFLAHRTAVRERFDIPWTGISPRMERLLYAINAVVQPRVMVAAGVFCGNTFVCNAGAAIGPGACYTAERLVGIEIVAPEAERAARNVATIDAAGQAEILAADAVEWLAANPSRIDLLYIDANGSYLPIVETAARSALPWGSLVLAHNSINQASQLAPYLRFVRDPRNSVESVNVMIDDQGLEVTLWRG